MHEQLVRHDRPAGSECFRGLFEVDGIPEHDRGDDEVQATGTETLVIESAILDHSTAVEAHRAAQRVLGLALVQANGYAAALERDDAAIEQWVRQRWPQLKKERAPARADRVRGRVGRLAIAVGPRDLSAQRADARAAPPLWMEAAVIGCGTGVRARCVGRCATTVRQTTRT